MSRTGKRQKIAVGVYRDNYGLAASVKVGKATKEKRYPFGADMREIKAWRESTKVKLRAHTPTVIRGTFASDAARYLRLVRGALGKATFKSRRSEVRAWSLAFGKATARLITAQTIMEAVSDWRAAGTSPKTIQNRVRTLAHLWRMLYDLDPPMRGVELPKVQKRRPIFVGPETIKSVEAKLRAFETGGRPKYKGPRVSDSCQRARFMVIATCGMRPAQLKRMTKVDVDLERRVVMIPAAKGGEPVGLWLNDDMLTAWQTFAQADAWGHFDTRGLTRLIQAAGWPDGVRPYNARHAVGIELAERGIDFRTIADFLGHRDDATTRAFYVPVLNSAIKRASESLEGRLGWTAESITAIPRASEHDDADRTRAGTRGGKLRIVAASRARRRA